MTSVRGTGSLLRLALRRDRVVLPLWVLLVTAFVAGSASSFATTYPTAADQERFAADISANPALTAIIGPVLEPGVGGLTAWRISTGAAVILAVVAVLTVVRHTRTDEVSGIGELARSTAVGRCAHLLAAFTVVALGMLVTAVATALALAAQGLPVAGSWGLALALASTGLVFAGLACVTTEICSTPRAATSTVLVALAVSMALRIAADAGGVGGPTAWLTWLTPTGWAQQVLPFTALRWWVFALPVLTVAAMLGIAFTVRSRRDLGAGLLPERPGPAHAGPSLSGQLGLAWRQNRGLVIGVVAGYALLGLLVGSVAPGAANAAAQLTPFLARLGVADAGQALAILLIYVMAEVLAAFAIMFVLRPRSDETGGLAAVLLSTPVSAPRWAGGHLLVALAATAAAMLALGAMTGLVLGLATGDLGGELAAGVGMAVSKLPAIWVLAGIASLALGLLPRAAVAISWTAFGIALVLELGWEFGLVPDGLFAVSPFSWVFPLAGRTGVVPAIGLLVVAAVLATGGLLALRRRDIG